MVIFHTLDIIKFQEFNIILKKIWLTNHL